MPYATCQDLSTNQNRVVGFTPAVSQEVASLREPAPEPLDDVDGFCVFAPLHYEPESSDKRAPSFGAQQMSIGETSLAGR
jgi:hypothetical protein